MTLISKNIFDKLHDVVNEYNNTYHRTIKMKPIGVKTSTYIDIGVENNDENPKFEIFGNSTYKQLIAFLSMNKKIIACTNL